MSTEPDPTKEVPEDTGTSSTAEGRERGNTRPGRPLA
jgi:hypothetical protein